jgi:hypothetical protein
MRTVKIPKANGGERKLGILVAEEARLARIEP